MTSSEDSLNRSEITEINVINTEKEIVTNFRSKSHGQIHVDTKNKEIEDWITNQQFSKVKDDNAQCCR